jgi:hypothetical protein
MIWLSLFINYWWLILHGPMAFGFRRDLHILQEAAVIKVDDGPRTTTCPRFKTRDWTDRI